MAATGVDLFKDPFHNICGTECNQELAVAFHGNDKCTHPILYYYVRSITNWGKVSKGNTLVKEFQKAADEWHCHTNIRFVRVFLNESRYHTEDDLVIDAPHFVIRSANRDEEDEKKTWIASAFFWSSLNEKRVVVWGKIKQVHAYTVFLHEIGHILGFRHEHVFLSAADRTAFSETKEKPDGYLLLQDAVDKDSIMSYEYLKDKIHDPHGEGGHLSSTDILQARNYYT